MVKSIPYLHYSMYAFVYPLRIQTKVIKKIKVDFKISINYY